VEGEIIGFEKDVLSTVAISRHTSEPIGARGAGCQPLLLFEGALLLLRWC